MIGRVLGNRYEILEEVGRGGMAYVYKAKCRLLNRIVAVKVLRNDLDGSGDFLKRFNSEAQAAASLSHPNIVSIYDVGVEDDIHYIVMEYVEGVTLKEYISIKRKLNWREAVNFAIEICSGLSAAHSQGIVHRDIKPHNIIVTETGQIKVTDFGIARCATSTTVAASDTVLGSVHYFSPEQARGRYVDNKTDIYSLGIVLYEMLSGFVPYDGENSIEVAMKHIEANPQPLCAMDPSIPPIVEQITFKAMKKETVARYPSVDIMREDLKLAMKNPNATLSVTGANMNISDAASAGYTIKMSPVTTQNDIGAEIKNSHASKNSDATLSRMSKMDNSYESDVKEEYGDKKNTKTIILAAISSVVLVAILAVLVYIFIFSTPGNDGKKDVPSLIGMTLEEAKKIAGEKGFTIEADGKVRDDHVAPGLIASQTPSGNSTTDDSTKVIIVKISGTPVEDFALEKYYGQMANGVRKKLENMGFKVVIESVPYEGDDEDIEEGYIFDQSPIDGTVVKTDSTVTLYVSSGRKVFEEDEIRELIDKRSIATTKRNIEKAGLKFGEIVEKYSKDNPRNTVLDIEASDGSPINKGDVVNVVVSNGYRTGSITLFYPTEYFEDNETELKFIAKPQNNDDDNQGENGELILGKNAASVASISVLGRGKVTYKMYVVRGNREKFIGTETVNFG